MSAQPQPTTSDVPTSWRRSPYFWAAVAGVITIPLIRPLTRYVPAPPPVMGSTGAYTLVNEQGQAFGSQDLAGHVYVTAFFFSSCTTVCPKIMAAMAKLQQRYAAAGVDVRLVSITVDPETDSPDKLRAFATRYSADPQRWTFLTGPRPALQDLIVKHFMTHMGEKTMEGDMMDIGHGARLVLVDREGGIRGHYESTDVGLDEVFHRSQHVLKAP